LKASRDCILVISDGRLFQSLKAVIEEEEEIIGRSDYRYSELTGRSGESSGSMYSIKTFFRSHAEVTLSRKTVPEFESSDSPADNRGDLWLVWPFLEGDYYIWNALKLISIYCLLVLYLLLIDKK
jgi:hypothetical protein